jgi:6-phosphofructokinase 1
LRGGSPTALDRILGLTFGAGAIQALSKGMNGVMVALRPPTIDFVPLEEAIARLKLVPIDSEFVVTSRALDICFGDTD